MSAGDSRPRKPGANRPRRRPAIAGKPRESKGRIFIKYEIGSTIYHPQHGIGTVRDYDKRELLGTEYKFAILFFPREELQISLPAKKLGDAVREPMTKSQAREFLDEMKSSHESLSKSWKIRSRNNQERLASGDPLKLYQVYRGLLELRAKKGSLNNSDRRQLQQALDLLAEEMAVALEKTPEQTKLILEQTTGQTVDAA